MDIKPMILTELKDSIRESSDLSFGEILYSILLKNNLKSKPDDSQIGWLRDIPDADFYTSVQNFIKNEKEFKKTQ
jgi:hypothetical protein|tara:strand:- start:9 stop:233 length:225 start_codon:yes stop_codon:yes gene_type:complete